MTDISVVRTPYQSEKRAWLLSPHGTEPGTMPSATLDVSKFYRPDHYPKGFIPSGTVLGKITATGLYGPYNGGESDEVQTLTVGGSGLTSFTLTFGGQTTGAIAAGASAAAVQAALEALSTVGAGNVLVTGSDGGVWTVRFQGDLRGTNVAQLTTTPTGGSGTVTAATSTAGAGDGASDGTDTAAGILFSSVNVINTDGSVKTKVAEGLLIHGFVDPAKLPNGIDAAGKADLKLIHFAS